MGVGFGVGVAVGAGLGDAVGDGEAGGGDAVPIMTVTQAKCHCASRKQTYVLTGCVVCGVIVNVRFPPLRCFSNWIGGATVATFESADPATTIVACNTETTTFCGEFDVNWSVLGLTEMFDLSSRACDRIRVDSSPRAIAAASSAVGTALVADAVCTDAFATDATV